MAVDSVAGDGHNVGTDLPELFGAFAENVISSVEVPAHKTNYFLLYLENCNINRLMVQKGQQP